MNIPFSDAMYLCTVAAVGGFFLGGAFNSALAKWREDSRALEREASGDHGISHVAPQRFGTMTEKQREKMRKLVPQFAEMEDVKIANERDAERVRRELAPGLPAVTIFPSLKAYREEREVEA